MDLFKFLKSRNNCSEVASVSDADIETLAVMCRHCEPKFSKKGFITRNYAYYVPQYEEDLEMAKNIFVKNGIPAKEYMSNIMGSRKEKVLRIDYRDVKSEDKLKHEMKRVKENMFSLFRSGKWLEKQAKMTEKQEQSQR